MFPREVQTLPRRKKTTNKLIVGVAAFLATGIITASGFAGAATMNGDKKPNPGQCKKAGFSSMVECEKAMSVSRQTQHNSQVNAFGHGYGYGGTSVGTNINFALNNSNYNVIQVIVNIFR